MNCEEGMCTVHAEVASLAKSAAEFAIRHFGPLRNEPPAEILCVVRASITQTLMERRAIPPALMGELVKHTYQYLQPHLNREP